VRLEVSEQRLELAGEAQTNYAGDVLTADTIRYLGGPRFIAARGQIELVGDDGKKVVTDSLLYYDVARLKGTVFDAETQFQQRGTNWRVWGNAIPVATDTVFVKHGAFSSCELAVPHYRFKAARIKLVSQNVIVAWSVVLYIANVPIFWMPFFAQDIRPGRHSGILPPRFGFNDIVRTSSNVGRQVSDFGYYWAISPYLDTQTTVDFFSGNYTRLNSAFRYRFLKKFIRGNISLGNSWGKTGRNMQIDWNHDQELGLATRLKVSTRYVQNTQLFNDRAFDPRLQTQTVDSDVGLTHRFSFADLSASARRRQFLSVDGRTELTLPSLNLTFSPVTLFRAPRNRQSLFSNLTWSGSGNFTRRDINLDTGDDTRTVTGGINSSFRLRDLSLSGSSNVEDVSITPIDSLGADLPAFSRTVMRWNVASDYKLDLIGSTTLRPTVRFEGAFFRSPDTGNRLISTPTRASFGALLSTDVFGFFPGFGPFSRIRHKFSPRFDWRYSPAVQLTPMQQAIANFPVRSGDARNMLTITLAQTFEAKLKPKALEAKEREERAARAAADSTAFAGADSVAVPPDTAFIPPDSITLVPREGARARRFPGAARGQGVGGLRTRGFPVSRARPNQPIVLLSINSSPLVFDFERPKRGESALVSEQFTNSFSSDLLRGLTINMTHDLFEGSGPGKKFAPFLQRLAANFSLRSGTSLSQIIGLGGTSAGRGRTRLARQPQRTDSRYRLREFQGEDPSALFDTQGETGPWDLSLRYSLLRVRQGEPGTTSQTIDGQLSFQPTPNWAIRWTTQYNFTEGSFGQHLITLDRNLHRWQASFQFAQAPNGNFLFQVFVSLKDAPELRVDYNQRSDSALGRQRVR